MNTTTITSLLLSGLLLVACGESQQPDAQATSAEPSQATTEEKVVAEEKADLESTAAAYWAAIAAQDWRTSYTMETYHKEDGSDAEVSELDYNEAMNKRWGNLKSYEVLQVRELQEEEMGAMGKVRVRTLKPSQFKAPVDLEKVFTDLWVQKDGKWLHRNPAVDSPGVPFAVVLSSGFMDLEGDKMGEISPEDRTEVRFVPGPGVRSNVNEPKIELPIKGRDTQEQQEQKAENKDQG